MDDFGVQAWSETVPIPTYGVGEPLPYPMFLEKRVYQGSSGAVYPYPVIESVSDKKADRPWTAVFLENAWLKIMILPELGGRIQMALDKTNGHHFVHYNRVIKPALVGLCGPWISGGIEFNWPQHHRPTTFSPLDWMIQRHPDGSATVWCSEIERMSRMKGMHGITLYPERAILEIRVQLCNRTSLPQTFLWWANPAVECGDDYQSVFPPDVHAVMDHGKRAVSDFPIATGVYYKVDYAPGTDISRYRNIPVPTSFMAHHSDYDFLGCYHHARQVGMLHVADHHLVPGKKQWTWGCGDFGKAWDRQLTDEDGPYVELMCGAFTDNQPDFSWLMPGEEKGFTQVFYPYKSIGPVQNASREAAVAMQVQGACARLGVYVTRPGAVEVELLRSGERLYHARIELSPQTAWGATVDLPEALAPRELTLRVSRAGRVLVEYTPLPDAKHPMPPPATPAPHPRDVASSEELCLHGLHLEQYRHASFAPEPYYEEALRRDPGDSRANNAMGRLLYRRGKFAEAEAHFRRAIVRLTSRNPNPYDGEPYYNLGLALKLQGRFDAAYDAFYKAVWNEAWKSAACFELARIACRRGAFDEALAFLSQCLDGNVNHHQALHLRIAVLRRLGRREEALQAIETAQARDGFNFGALYESNVLAGDAGFAERARGNVHTLIELALDYAHAGMFDDAAALLKASPRTDPMARYYLAWVHAEAGRESAARAAFADAATLSPDFCFPHRVECVNALQCARRLHPGDARAAYYLGNFWYAHRCYEEAIAAWEQSAQLHGSLAAVHRNLALAYFNQRGQPRMAREAMGRAFALAPGDARLLLELDQLYRRLNCPVAERLKFLEQHRALVEKRDDLTVEYVKLLNSTGQHERALEILVERVFHPWEGGEGKVTGQYVLALAESAWRDMTDGNYDAAIEKLTRSRTYPHNLGEGKLYGARENHIDYWLGCAHAARGDGEAARRHWRAATAGSTEPASALYYHDQPPEMIYYQGLAHRRLGDEDQARAILRGLVDYGEKHLEDDVKTDYFAVSLPDLLVFDDDPVRRHRVHCEYMLALGWLGVGEEAKSREHFARVLALEADHAGAILHRPDGK